VGNLISAIRGLDPSGGFLRNPSNSAILQNCGHLSDLVIFPGGAGGRIPPASPDFWLREQNFYETIKIDFSYLAER
jgi:hypothetical protein